MLARFYGDNEQCVERNTAGYTQSQISIISEILRVSDRKVDKL